MSWQWPNRRHDRARQRPRETPTAVTRRRLGVVKAGAPFALDLRGRATNVDLRNLPPMLPAPKVTSNLQFDYTLSVRGSAWQASANPRPIDAGGRVDQLRERRGRSRSAQRGAPTYTAKGEIAGLDVQRVGREFHIQALATDRYRSAVSGTFDMAGSGGGRYPLTLDVTGTLVDSQLFGALFPRMDVTTNLSRTATSQVQTAGSFAGLDPAVVTGERARRRKADRVDRRARPRFVDYAERHHRRFARHRGHVELGPSTIGEADDRFGGRRRQLCQPRGPVEAAGDRRCRCERDRKGAIALNDTGASNLTLHADTPSLDRIGELIGQPLKGAARRRRDGHGQCARAQGRRHADRQQRRAAATARR